MALFLAANSIEGGHLPVIKLPENPLFTVADIMVEVPMTDLIIPDIPKRGYRRVAQTRSLTHQ
jgi:hypothetical protein